MKGYTIQELEEMLTLKESGVSYKEIAEMYGRTQHGVEQKLHVYKRKKKAAALQQQKGPEKAEKVEKKLVKLPTLEDFKPRDMIKHLYKLGYRIENNKLVFVKKEIINIQQLLEEA